MFIGISSERKKKLRHSIVPQNQMITMGNCEKKKCEFWVVAIDKWTIKSIIHTLQLCTIWYNWNTLNVWSHCISIVHVLREWRKRHRTPWFLNSTIDKYFKVNSKHEGKRQTNNLTSERINNAREWVFKERDTFLICRFIILNLNEWHII